MTTWTDETKRMASLLTVRKNNAFALVWRSLCVLSHLWKLRDWRKASFFKLAPRTRKFFSKPAKRRLKCVRTCVTCQTTLRIYTSTMYSLCGTWKLWVICSRFCTSNLRPLPTHMKTRSQAKDENLLLNELIVISLHSIFSFNCLSASKKHTHSFCGNLWPSKYVLTCEITLRFKSNLC